MRTVICKKCAFSKEQDRNQAEQKRRFDESIEGRRLKIEALAVLPSSDLTRLFRGELSAEAEARGTKLGDYTGQQIAQAVLGAGWPGRQNLVRVKSFMRPAQFERGWPLTNKKSGDGEVSSSTTSTFLVASGSIYEQFISSSKHGGGSSELQILRTPDQLVPPGTIENLLAWWELYGSRGKY